MAHAGRARELLQVTEQEIKLTISPVRQAKLLYRSAELALELGDQDYAHTALLQALDTLGDHQPSMALLERLLRDRGDVAGLVELLRRRINLPSAAAEEQLSLRLEIAHLLLGLDDVSTALAEVEPILQAWPEHLSTLQLGVRLTAATADQGRQLKYLQQHFSVARGHRSRALLAYRVGLLLRDPVAAVTALGRALALWPQLGGGHATCLTLAERTDDPTRIRIAARAGLAQERGAGNRQAFALRLAELVGSPTTNTAAAALPYLQAVADARPSDLGVALRLARVARFTGHPGLAAPALARAADLVVAPAKDLASHPAVQSLRYRAARDYEQAGDLGAATSLLAAIVTTKDPQVATLARNAKARIDARKAAQPNLHSAAETLAASASGEAHASDKALVLTCAAELLVRSGDLQAARARLDAAIQACAAYLPALHLRACVAEQLAATSDAPATDLLAAAADLEQLAAGLHEPRHAYPHLCRAGLLALRAGAAARAWKPLAQALTLDPAAAPAFAALWRLRAAHGREGARTLLPALEQRLDRLRAAGELHVDALRAISRMAVDSDGPAVALRLLERGRDAHPDNIEVSVDLGRLYARVGRWSDAATQVLGAAKQAVAPERQAMLQFLAADALERAGAPETAFDHYLAASAGGYQSARALIAADRIASAIGTLEQRVEVLERLIHLGDPQERVRSLRSLSELCRGPLGQPERAAGLLRELLKLRPSDTDAILALFQLLGELDREEEGRVALQAGIAAHRAILRNRGLRSDSDPTALDATPMLGLLRLFDAAEEPGGVYMCAAVLEVIDPDLVPPHRHCDVVKPEPWPLPSPPVGAGTAVPAPFFTADDPAGAAALGLLRAGVHDLTAIPGAPPPKLNLSQRHSLPSTSSVGTVTRAIGRTLGLGEPLLFLNSAGRDEDHRVVAYVGTAPVLLIGRKINAAPFSPAARDAIGRALFRLATGGDHLQRGMDEAQLMGVLKGLASCAGVELDDIHPTDQDVADTIIEALAGAAIPIDFGDDAEQLGRTIEQFSVTHLRALLERAEDRAGTIACGDPRISLRIAAAGSDLASPRATSLVAYLVSEEHLNLRRQLGYFVELELELTDVEELPT